MLNDSYGNPVTTDSTEAVAAIDRFAASFLGYGTDFAVIYDGAAASPDCALAHTQGVVLGLFMETAAGLDLAAQSLDQARAAIGHATMRERLYLRAVEAWHDGDLRSAVQLHEEIADRYPRDIAAAKLGQTHYFNLGDSQGMLRLAEKIIDSHRQTAYAWGMLAFGLEQCHRLDDAEAAGRRATTMQPAEPWAHHAVAHVLETRGQLAEGIAWMERHADTWDGCNSFMYTHNWWHVALYLIDLGDYDHALELYDRRVWGIDKSYSQDQAGAVALLWRLELRGIDVGDRWHDVARQIAARSLVHIQPFHDMHFVYALARAGRSDALERFMAGLEGHAAAVDPFLRAAWQEVCLPACRGLIAHAEGNFTAAYDWLEPVRQRFQEIGGSHAQRDLFEQTCLDLMVRTGRHDQAIPTLEGRVAARPAVGHHLRQLADAYSGAGRADDAAATLGKAALLVGRDRQISSQGRIQP